MADSYTCRFTEAHKILAHVHPASYAINTNTGWADLTSYHRAVAILFTGALLNTLDVSVWQATDTNGANAKALTGKVVTQLAATDDNSICAIEIRTEELDVDNGFHCIRVNTVNQAGAQGNIYSVIVLGIVSRFEPVGTAEWDEVID